MSHFAIPDKALRQLDSQVSEERRDEGMWRANRNAPTDWKEAANEALRVLMRQRGHGGEILGEDIWYLLEACGVPLPPDGRALGPLLGGAARRGWLVSTGHFRPTTRPSRHKAPEAVWAITELGAEQDPKRTLPEPNTQLAPPVERDEGPAWEIGEDWITVGKMTLTQVSRGSGFVCSDCACEVDSRVRGPHTAACSLRAFNESLYDGWEAFSAYEAARK